MTAPAPTIRRATVDDLPPLRRLWTGAGLDAAAAEKRVGEFQLVLDPTGVIVACAAITKQGREGRILSIAFLTPAAHTAYAAALWDRTMNLVRNHAFVRLWTAESHLWVQNRGFEPAEETVLKKLPTEWQEAGKIWTFIKLRDESADAVVLEREFDLLRQSRDQDYASFQGAVRKAKMLAWILAIGFGIICGWLVIKAALVMPMMKK